MWKHVQRSAVAVIIGLGLVLAVRPARGDSWHVTVRGGDADLGETPVVVELKELMPVGPYVVESPSGEGIFMAQVFQEKGGRRLGVVLPRVDARRSVTYTLKDALKGDAASPSGISFETHDRNLKVKLDEQLFTEYQVGIGNKPYFFPLIGPTGDPYTRSYPMLILPDEDHDHPHQRSCWFTFGKVNDVDFWSEGKRFGTIKETGRTLVAAGPVVGRLTTTNEWRAADDRRFCVDERTVTFYRTRTTRIIDFEFRIAASDGPVTFGDTKEGMFGIRVASSMDVTKKQGGRITNAEGLTDENAWGKPSQWVDYVGPVKDKIVGIAMINHPLSFRYPTTWHVRTYGLFAANPFGWHDFGRAERGDYTIPAGQAITFSYRVVLHERDTRSANVSALAAAFTKPPDLEIRKD
jgi:Methane oxygenase PmoA